MEHTKVAVIREPGYPVGQPAPCYLNCPCGEKPPVPVRHEGNRTRITCRCGTVYDENGRVVTPRPASSGFALVELLVTLAVLGLVLAGVAMAHHAATQTALTTRVAAAITQGGRSALDRFTRELRASATGLTAATATSLTFVDQDNRSIVYALDGSRLVRRIDGAADADAVLDGVRELRLVYYSDAVEVAAPVGTPSDITAVAVTVRLARDAGPGAVYTTSVALRNAR